MGKAESVLFTVIIVWLGLITVGFVVMVPHQPDDPPVELTRKDAWLAGCAHVMRALLDDTAADLDDCDTRVYGEAAMRLLLDDDPDVTVAAVWEAACELTFAASPNPLLRSPPPGECVYHERVQR